MLLRWTMQWLLLLSWEIMEINVAWCDHSLYQNYVFLQAQRHNSLFKAKWLPRQEECTLNKINNYGWKQEVITDGFFYYQWSHGHMVSYILFIASMRLPSMICNCYTSCLRVVLCIYRLKSFISRLTLKKPPRMRNRLFHKPMQA